MKYDWKKQDKGLYGAKQIPSFVNVPLQNFIMICGKGNPNDADFSNRVAALYSFAYAVKMIYKSAAFSSEICDFSVYPLEGIWKAREGTTLIKENLEYTIMIRQPDFIPEEIIAAALERIKVKKPNPLYGEIRFDAVQGGTYAEILHIGPFDDEPASFEKMDEFVRIKGRKRAESRHREIYMNHANRVEKSKLKTILRYLVK